jgi:hypothetical protein
MRPSIKLIYYAFLFTLFLLIILLSFEIAFRISGKYHIAGIEYNKEGLWRWRANLNTIEWNQEAGSFKVYTDKNGFRNTGKSYKKAANAVRILIIGDSYTAGITYPQDRIYTQLLEDKLRELKLTGKNIEVFNMSSPAWGTEQEYLCLKNEGMSINPDFVLLMTCPNDIREIYCKKFAVLSNGKVQFNGNPFGYRDIFRWKLANYSCFYQFLQSNLFHTNYGTFDQLMGKFIFNFGVEDSKSWDRPLFLKKSFPQLDEAEQLYDTLLVDMKRICDSNHAKFAVSCTPFTFEFDGSLANDSAVQAGIVSDKIERFCNQQGISYINLYRKFAAQPNAHSLFTTWDSHFNTKGFQLVAETLKDYYQDKVK